MKKLILLLLFLPVVLAQTCDGCIYDEECFDVGSQRQFVGGTYYCSGDGGANLVKPIEESCSNNYECVTFFCDGVCKEVSIEEATGIYGDRLSNYFLDFNYFFYLIPFIILISLIALIWYIYGLFNIRKGKKTEKKEKKEVRKPKRLRRIRKRRDELEENIRRSMKDVSDTFRKNK